MVRKSTGGRVEMKSGLIVGSGPETTGFLAGLVMAVDGWMDKDRSQLSWRTGTARFGFGFGSSLLYYHARDPVHDFLKSDGLTELKKRLTPPGVARYLNVVDADAHVFDLGAEEKVIRKLHAFHCSFEHVPEPGFLKRFYGELASSQREQGHTAVRIVQHDVVLLDRGTHHEGRTHDHWIRVHASFGEAALARETIDKCLKHAATGHSKPWIAEFGERPNPVRGVTPGAFARGIAEQRLQVGCVRILARTICRDNHGSSDLNLDLALEKMNMAMLAASHWVEVSCDREATPYGEQRLSNPRALVRMSMRYVGGWMFVLLHVLTHKAEEQQLRELIRREAGKPAGVVVEHCEVDCPESPIVLGENDVFHLPTLRHVDTPGYLAQYFKHVDGDDGLTKRASVVQYDSYSQRYTPIYPDGRNAAHELCIAVVDPCVSPADCRGILNQWHERHRTWMQRVRPE